MHNDCLQSCETSAIDLTSQNTCFKQHSSPRPQARQRNGKDFGHWLTSLEKAVCSSKGWPYVFAWTGFPTCNRQTNRFKIKATATTESSGDALCPLSASHRTRCLSVAFSEQLINCCSSATGNGILLYLAFPEMRNTSIF